MCENYDKEGLLQVTLSVNILVNLINGLGCSTNKSITH